MEVRENGKEGNKMYIIQLLPLWGTETCSFWGSLGVSIDHMAQSHPCEGTELRVISDSHQKLIEGYWEGGCLTA